MTPNELLKQALIDEQKLKMYEQTMIQTSENRRDYLIGKAQAQMADLRIATDNLIHHSHRTRRSR